MREVTISAKPAQARRPAYLALGSICFFWGTTYLGIRMALESFPPFVLVSARFLLSGSLMLLGSLLVKAPLPRGRELVLTGINGILVLGIGNGCLTFSELWIPSGLAALIVTTSAFWMVGVETLLPGGDRLHLPTIAGLVVGGLGAALLLAPGIRSGSVSVRVIAGFLVLQLGCLFWSLGSIRQRRLARLAHPFVSGAVQQLAAGLAFLPLALLFGRHSVNWQFRGVSALLYLVMFGSIVGYSSYIYALDKLPVALVSIYTYVNPIVAVLLGWLFYREPFSRMEAFAMAVIFLGVALVKHYSRPKTAVELD
jgi:drug/metabolite transporter (DMT)-like permease